jgi:hypothetical protein
VEFYGPEWPSWLQFVRIALSLWAAIGTYRMVRRRRRVWFRNPYGSRAYKQDEARRQKNVEETDRSTTLGRMILAFRHRRVLKRLRKAETMFTKKLRRQGSPPSSPSSSPSTRLLVLNRQLGSSGSSSSSEDEAQEEVSYASTGTASPPSMRRRHRSCTLIQPSGPLASPWAP